MSERRDISNLPPDGGVPEAPGMPHERISSSKRTLLKAGWVAPVIVVLNLPGNSFAQNSSGATPPPTKSPLQPVPSLPPEPPWWWPRWWRWPPW
jgi:hypothetical protein